MRKETTRKRLRREYMRSIIDDLMKDDLMSLMWLCHPDITPDEFHKMATLVTFYWEGMWKRQLRKTLEKREPKVAHLLTELISYATPVESTYINFKYGI